MRFTVIGVAKAQPRVKARHIKTKDGREFTSVYTPTQAKTWKALVAQAAQAEPDFPKAPWAGPVHLYVAFYLPRPKRLYRKKDPQGPMWAPTRSRNDCDNLLKAVMDALSDGGLWRDDGQVVTVAVSKAYHARDEGPHAIIEVSELVSEPRWLRDGTIVMPL